MTRLSMHRHSSSGRVKVKVPNRFGGVGMLVTAFLLAGILVSGPLLLGAIRLWVELPLLGAVALLLVVQGLRLMAPAGPDSPRTADAIDLTVLLFVLYTAIRWLTSPTEYFSRIETMDVVAYAGIFFTCRYGMANRRCCFALLFLLVILGVGEAAFGYYLSHYSDPGDAPSLWFPFGPAERAQVEFFPRWLGTYASSDHYASLLVMAVGAALALGSFSKLSWPLRIILFYFAAMMMVGLTYSASRGGWIALVAAILALVIFGIRNGTMRWWFPVGGAMVLLLVAGALFSLSAVAQHRFELGEKDFTSKFRERDERVQLARDALRIAHDHLFFGTGPGTFPFVHPHYETSAFWWEDVLTHDDYLNCLDDYGLVGFGLAMFFVAAVTLKFFHPLWVDNRWQDRAVVATGFAAWTALLVHSWVDYNLHIPANALLLFALTGLSMGRIKKDSGMGRGWSTLPLAPLGRSLGWIVVFLSLGYGAEVARTAASNIAFENAQSRADTVPVSESIDTVQQALDYDEGNAPALLFLGDLERDKASLQKDGPSRTAEAQKALEAYQRALSANSLADTATARMGLTYDLIQNYPQALACYKLALAAQPYNGQFWFWLGNHYRACGMFPKAEQAYLKSLICHHGHEESRQAENDLRALPEMKDVPRPPWGSSPLESSPAGN